MAEGRGDGGEGTENTEAAQKQRLRAAVEEALISGLFLHAPVGLLVVDSGERRIRALSRYGLRLLGLGDNPFDPACAVSASTLGVASGGSAFASDPPWMRALEGELFEAQTWTVRRPDGHLVTLLASGQPLIGPSGEIAAALVTFAPAPDPTSADRTAAKLAALIESSEDAIICEDLDGVIQSWSAGAERIFGHRAEEAVGRPITILAPLDRIEDAARVLERIRRGERALAHETERITKDGRRVAISLSLSPFRDASGRIVGALGVARDLTAQRRTAAAMVHAQRLASLGVLAGGVAHDFNNTLTAIVGNLELARLHAGHEGVIEALTLAERAVDQARDLARQLLAFSRRGERCVKTVALGDFITHIVRFALRGSSVLADFRIDDDLWPARVDEGDFGQAIHGIVEYARQAMERGGELSVSAKNVLVSQGDPSRLPPGHYLRLAFEDEGAGLAGSELARIFEPCSGAAGIGGELGLAATFAIVRAHGGHIAAQSKLGEGTTFIVHLPASEEPAEPLAPRAAGRVEPKGTILLMDDDASVREVGLALLARLGFEVKLASDGREAVALYRQALEGERPFAAVILDLTVPGGMGGTECLSLLKAIDPAVKALVSSGYSSDLVMSAHEEYGFEGVVPKPYRLADLSNALASVLGAP
jgi:PAS domain S-box-containing protein